VKPIGRLLSLEYTDDDASKTCVIASLLIRHATVRSTVDNRLSLDLTE